LIENRSITTQGAGQRPIVFGEVLFDRFPDGAVLGGAPFNVAWHLQGFGCAPLFLSRVGDDGPGEQVKQAMRAWGLDIAGLQTDASHPTGTVEINLAAGKHSFDILPDQAYDYIDLELARTAIAHIDPALVYHGTLITRTDQTRAVLDDLLQLIAAPVFLDVNLREPWWRKEDLPNFLQRAQWVKVNDEELEIISKLLGYECHDIITTADRILADYDLEFLIVTRGAEGAITFRNHDDPVEIVPKKQDRVVDTVGAGDAFTSIVLLGILRRWPLEQTMERAQAFASRICGQRGATSLDGEIYHELHGQLGGQAGS